jgi:hypothetical protein
MPVASPVFGSELMRGGDQVDCAARDKHRWWTIPWQR